MKKLRGEYHVRQGYSYKDRGDYDSAEQCFLKALSILKGLGNVKQRKIGMALQHSNLGLLYHQKMRMDDAVDNLKTAIDLYNEIGVVDDSAPLYASLGKVYYDCKDYDAAEKTLKKALEIYKQRRHAREAIDTINRLLDQINVNKGSI